MPQFNTPLAQKIWAHTHSDGYTQTALKELQLLRTIQGSPRCPVSYQASIVIVAQGRKRCFLEDNTFLYDPQHYLVVAVPIPFECEVVASPTVPFLGLSIGVNPVTIGELLVEMGEDPTYRGPLPNALYSATMDQALEDAAKRLVTCLDQPRDLRILGPRIVREILYRVLCGPHAQVLRAAASRSSHFAQIAKVLRQMQGDLQEKWDIDTLASVANMSPTVFHQTFKAVTASTPLQYLKSIRLHKARLLMIHDGCNAGTAADRVGYVSPSQFSRDFKRLFGSTPVQELNRHRQAPT